MKEKPFNEVERDFMEQYRLTEQEMVFFRHVYRREMVFKTVIAIETLAIALLSYLLCH